MRLEIYQSSQVPACCQLLGGVLGHPAGPRAPGAEGAGRVSSDGGGAEAEGRQRSPDTKALQTSERPLGFVSSPKRVFSQAGTDQICLEHRREMGVWGTPWARQPGKEAELCRSPQSPSQSGATVYPPVQEPWSGLAASEVPQRLPPAPQDEPIALDKQHSRDSTAITHSTYSLPASYSQDPVYVNGGLNYSYRGYGALGSNLQPPASLQTGNHSNGECGTPGSAPPDQQPGGGGGWGQRLPGK